MRAGKSSLKIAESNGEMSMVFTRIFIIASIVLGASLSAYAQDRLTVETLIAEKTDRLEVKVKGEYPDFRFLKSLETFPPRPKATKDIKVDSFEDMSLVTLHHKRTGQPLESCTTPCILHGRSNRTYILSMYKDGYIPMIARTGPMNWAKGQKLFFIKDDTTKLMEQFNCYQAFQKSEKVDQGAKPCLRTPPHLPPKIRKSGHCFVSLDVNARGKPQNVKIKSCTDKVLEANSLNAVKEWYYTPKVQNGVAVVQTGLEEKIRYRLDNGKGKVLR